MLDWFNQIREILKILLFIVVNNWSDNNVSLMTSR
jgi:hypothetical protein